MRLIRIKALPLFLCLTLSLSLSGCGVFGGSKSSAAQQDADYSSSADTSETNAPIQLPVSTPGVPPQKPDFETTSETTAVTTLPLYMQEVDFTWRPYVMSKIYANLYGDKFTSDFQSMVTAFLNYESTFPCSSSEEADQINTAAASCFPLLHMDVSYITYDKTQKMGVLDFIWPQEDHMAGIKGFKDSITEFITSCVKKSDNELTIAMALYMAYSSKITYDFAALSDNTTADVSSYRGLTEYAGICQTFGPAYAYLCLETGIDAVTAGGLSTEETAHEWTLVKLDGDYYYMDTTWQNGDGGAGLTYFGLTSQERESAGDFTISVINIGDTNVIWGNDIAVNNERFSDLHCAVYASFNTDRTQVDCIGKDGSQWTFPLET